MFSNIVSSIVSSLHRNSQRIFAVVGAITVIVTVLYGVWKATEFIINQPSFSFDPLTTGVILVIGLMLVTQQAEHNKIVRTQNLILRDLIELKNKKE